MILDVAQVQTIDQYLMLCHVNYSKFSTNSTEIAASICILVIHCRIEFLQTTYSTGSHHCSLFISYI